MYSNDSDGLFCITCGLRFSPDGSSSKPLDKPFSVLLKYSPGWYMSYSDLKIHLGGTEIKLAVDESQRLLLPAGKYRFLMKIPLHKKSVDIEVKEDAVVIIEINRFPGRIMVRSEKLDPDHTNAENIITQADCREKTRKLLVAIPVAAVIVIVCTILLHILSWAWLCVLAAVLIIDLTVSKIENRMVRKNR